jgi:hypothetical protein
LMDTVAAIDRRRSIRDYEKRAVGRKIIADILWDAAQAPTTPVSGPFLFHVIEGAARIADLGEQAKQYAREHRPDAVGYSWSEKSEFRVFLDSPVVIVISGHADNSQSIQDCSRAGQNLVLSAHARGLGSCWVGAPMLWLGSPRSLRALRSLYARLCRFGATIALARTAGDCVGLTFAANNRGHFTTQAVFIPASVSAMGRFSPSLRAAADGGSASGSGKIGRFGKVRQLIA